ncbi:hypothetical protein HDU85_007534 [Gaertneriomyces sp. JEL0708]|nr:hypothetical protein HDU85_007534 [Gaertneriomyces sp. JEL0708]
MLFIVTGATGHVGSRLVDKLLAEQHNVRCIIRDPRKAPALEAKKCTTALASLEDQSALASALASTDQPSTVFLLNPDAWTTDMYQAAETVGRNFALAVKRAGNVRRVVFLSSLGAECMDFGILKPLHIIESILKSELTCELVFIRPTLFMENWQTSLMGQDQAQPTLVSLYPADLSIDMIAVEDVAGCIATFMTQERLPRPRTVVEALGPKAYTPDDVMRVVERILGKKLTFHETNANELRAQGESLGWSNIACDAMAETTEATKQKKVKSLGVPTVDAVVRGTVTLESFCEKWLSQGGH